MKWTSALALALVVAPGTGALAQQVAVQQVAVSPSASEQVAASPGVERHDAAFSRATGLAERPQDVLVPGARVRMPLPWNPERHIVGTVLKTHGDTVVVDTADVFAQNRLFNPAPVPVDGVRRISVPVEHVQKVEVSMGRSRWMGALRGATLGALAVGTYAGVMAINGRQNPSFGDVASGFLGGAPLGFVLGAPVGWVYTTERWRAVPLLHTGVPSAPHSFGQGN